MFSQKIKFRDDARKSLISLLDRTVLIIMMMVMVMMVMMVMKVMKVRMIMMTRWWPSRLSTAEEGNQCWKRRMCLRAQPTADKVEEEPDHNDDDENRPPGRWQ